MAIRTIDAPGVEIHEIDKSQYSPAMTGTKVLVTGFANSGEDYTPMIFTSKSAWLNYYGEPDNEAERYFYAASMEVMNQNGVVNCCKLPYENEARDKFVGMKYKLKAARVGEITTVSEALSDPSGELYPIKAVLPNSEVFRSDVIGYFVDNCNIADSVDKDTLQKEMLSSDPCLTVLSSVVNQEDRSDGRTESEVSGKTFYGLYGGELSTEGALIKAFTAQMTKKQLIEYVNDLSSQTMGLIPRLNAYYFIDTLTSEVPPSGDAELTSTQVSVHQDISVVMACDENGNYAVLTAVNDFVSADVSSMFTVEDIDDLIVSDPETPGSNHDDIFAAFTANRDDTLTHQYFDNNSLFVRFTNGIDAFQLKVDGATVPADHEHQDSCYDNMLAVIRQHNFNLRRGDRLEDAFEYFDEIRSNTKALHDAKVESINTILAWSEIKMADPTVDKFWTIEAGESKPFLLDMVKVDEYRTDESRVGTNEILVVDKTRKPYGKIPEDAKHKNDGRELIGVIPIITTAANALYAQSMIDVDDMHVTDYETVKELRTQDASPTYNTIKSDEAGASIISKRLNNIHVDGDSPDEFFESLSLEANSYFSSIALAADGGFDRENMKKIGLVVVKAFLDASEGNKISFQTVESFVGSLDRDAKNPNTGATTFIDTLVNEQSEYVNIFTNCIPTDAYRKTYKEEVDILVMPFSESAAASLGFYEGQVEEDIDISESILKALDMVYDKVTDINERDIDIVVDGGISNIAQFIKTVYGKKGFYDPASPDAALWKCKKDNDVKMWKTVVMKMDNFCKNIRKDCMFVCDGPRPFCLQGQKKIVRPSKPTNTIDADILPFVKYLTGINTSYGAGYCDWFQVADEFSGDYFWCPPSIKACGVYIFTDLNYEYWDAPAGLNRGIVAALDVAFSPTMKQAGQIYTKSWNYAVNYPLEGIVLEGQRTLQTKPSALDRVNVRRLMLRFERATYKVLRYIVYEGNTAYMRQRVVDLLDPYFKEAKIGGGVYDYKIICDESNNTPTTIDRNELHISIGIKPTKTIEFIVCNFVILSTGASWDEM